jgi:hypothetical protein
MAAAKGGTSVRSTVSLSPAIRPDLGSVSLTNHPPKVPGLPVGARRYQ